MNQYPYTEQLKIYHQQGLPLARDAFQKHHPPSLDVT